MALYGVSLCDTNRDVYYRNDPVKYNLNDTLQLFPLYKKDLVNKVFPIEKSYFLRYLMFKMLMD